MAGLLSLLQFKDWLRQAFAYNFAQTDAMRRDSAARGMGLDPGLYNRPFPGSPMSIVDSSVTTTQLPAPAAAPAPAAPAPSAVTVATGTAPSPAAGWKVPAVVGGVLLAAAGIFGGAALLKPTTTPTTTPAAVVKPADPAAAQTWTIHWHIDANGNYVEDSRERVK